MDDFSSKAETETESQEEVVEVAFEEVEEEVEEEEDDEELTEEEITEAVTSLRLLSVRVTAWLEVREKTILHLREMADYIDQVHRRSNKAKVE